MSSPEPMECPPLTPEEERLEKAKDQLMYLFSQEGLAWLVIDLAETYDKKLIKILVKQYDARIQN